MTQNLIQHIAKSIHQMAIARKKVGKLTFTVEDIIYLLTVIMQINALGEFDTRLGDELISEVKIPRFLSDFVYPAKVGGWLQFFVC